MRAAAPGQCPGQWEGHSPRLRSGGLPADSELAAWLQAGSKVDLEEVPEGCQLSHMKPCLCFLLCYMVLPGLQVWMLMQKQHVVQCRERRNEASPSSLRTVVPLESQAQDDCGLLIDTE